MSSSGEFNDGGDAGRRLFRCYYDLLQADPGASQAELRRAYRRQALLWHPDKQPAEWATAAAEQFRLVQRAYEILGDPRTRAWYDRHRDRILRGGGASGPDQPDFESVVSVFEYFPPGCYRDYGDGPDGFFGVYGRLFEHLASELESAADGTEPPPTMPEFGQSNSDYESVVAPFYARWEEARFAAAGVGANESMKHRRSEEIRVLIAFVKAWDPRVFDWRIRAAADLLTGLAEEEALRASVGRSVLAGLTVGFGALIGGALLSRRGGGGFGLALGAACAGAAYAVASRGRFVSLSEALRSMPADKRTRLAERTLDALREVNAMDTATWASLLVSDGAFRSRLLSQARRFASGSEEGEGNQNEGGGGLLPCPAAQSEG